MKTGSNLDVCCFTYIASAEVLRVSKYPKPNYGAIVKEKIYSVVADGVVVSIGATKMGLRAGLITNMPGKDKTGKGILKLLNGSGVLCNVKTGHGMSTPSIVVITDDDGTRTWFVDIAKAVEDLMYVDLDLINKSSLTYVDLYEVIEKPGLRAIGYSNMLGIPIFLNLGERQIDSNLLSKLEGKHYEVIQLSCNEALVCKAEKIGSEVLNALKPKLVIVTLGSKGAIALTSTTQARAYAYSVKLINTNNAGAAFTVGFLRGYLNSWDIEMSLQYGCALGSLNCSIKTPFDHFSEQVIENFVFEHKMII